MQGQAQKGLGPTSKDTTFSCTVDTGRAGMCPVLCSAYGPASELPALQLKHSIRSDAEERVPALVGHCLAGPSSPSPEARSLSFSPLSGHGCWAGRSAPGGSPGEHRGGQVLR